MNDAIWFVLARPYTLINGERVPNFTGMRSPTPIVCSGNPCPYEEAHGGEMWAVVEELPDGTNSLEEATWVMEDIIETYGYKLEYVKLVCEMNADIYVRPRM